MIIHLPAITLPNPTWKVKGFCPGSLVLNNRKCNGERIRENTDLQNFLGGLVKLPVQWTVIVSPVFTCLPSLAFITSFLTGIIGAFENYLKFLL